MGQRVRFGSHTVDLGSRTVECDGTPISLEPQVFDVLALLIEHRDRVVTKLELLDRVWGDRFVSPATLTSRVRDLRAALGDSGRSQHVVKTVHGRGFQFVARLDVVDEAQPAGFGAPTPLRTPAAEAGLKPLVGRADLLDEVHRRLAECRLVTLVGPGGVGKTHLMRHATAGLGAIVTDLTDVRDGDALLLSMLSAVGGTERADADVTEALAEMLAGRHILLVLDNCEHVIDAAIAATAELLRRCPGLRILATSRRPLQLGEETVIRVGQLDAESAADVLIGHAARHGVTLDRSDELLDVCRRLDGLPLALELAASKTRAIPLGDLSRLLGERLELLTDETNNADAHHASLDTAIRWSVDLLTERQRELLARFGVFVGQFDLAAVDTVCVGPGSSDRTETITDLVALVDLSLVEFDVATGRYRLLEPIRMFAESLGIDDDVRLRYRNHVLDVVDAAAPIRVATAARDLDAIRTAWPSLRALVATARAETDAATLHRAVAAVTRFAEQTFSFEVIDWAEAAIALDVAADRPTPPETHLALALLRTHRSDFDVAADHLARVEGADPSLVELARLWHHYFTGDLAATYACRDRLREIADGTGSYVERVAITAGHFLDKGAQRPFDPIEVARLDSWATDGDPVVAASAALCTVLRLDWDSQADEAIEALTTIIETARRLGLAFLASGASTARSIVLSTSPGAESSARVLRATLRSYVEVSSWQFALADFAAASLALVHGGRARDAAELLGARRAAGYVGDSSAEVEDQATEAARRALGDRAFDEAVRQGHARDVATATRLAIAAFDQIIGDRVAPSA